MHYATPAHSSFRGYSSGGARCTIDKPDDNKLMQEIGGNFMSNETRTGIEAAQNYGFTSVVADGDQNGSAECFVDFCGGNRGFPRAGPTDDRRHRLRGLSSGDSAMHRGKDDDMQIHLAGDGMYHSAPQMVRMQLVPSGSGRANPPQSKPQASQTKQAVYARHGPHIETRLWAGLEPELQEQLDIEVEQLEQAAVAAQAGNGGGGSSSSGSDQQQQGQKPTGQKSVSGAGQNSKDFMHVKSGEGRLSSGSKVRLSNGKEDSDVLHEASSKKDWCGGTPSKGQYSLVVTVKGPTINVMGKISE